MFRAHQLASIKHITFVSHYSTVKDPPTLNMCSSSVGGAHSTLRATALPPWYACLEIAQYTGTPKFCADLTLYGYTEGGHLEQPQYTERSETWKQVGLVDHSRSAHAAALWARHVLKHPTCTHDYRNLEPVSAVRRIVRSFLTVYSSAIDNKQ